MRPKGRLNDKTLRIQRMCRALVEDPAYQSALRDRLIAGTLGQMEAVIWHYGYGKPKENIDVRVDVNGGDDLESLSLDELNKTLDELKGQLKEAQALEAAIPAVYRIE